MSAITITGIVHGISVQGAGRLVAISSPGDLSAPSVLVTLPTANTEGIEVWQAVEVIVQAPEQAD